MARIVRCSLVQAKNVVPAGPDGAGAPLAAIKQPMIDKHISMARAAAADGAQIVCLQEILAAPTSPPSDRALALLCRARPQRPHRATHDLAGKRAWRRAGRSHL